MAARKALSLQQCRFLGDQLQMEGFEQLLVDSPLRFLQDLAVAFRLHSPFNTVHVAQALKRTGKFPTLSLEEAKSEMLSGRGGSCLLTAPFLEDFLVTSGLRAHLVFGFNVARSLRRDSFHNTVLIRDVEKRGDLFHFDVSTSLPFLSVIDMTGVIQEEDGSLSAGERENIATPIYDSLHRRYQLVNGKRFLSYLNLNAKDANDESEQPRQASDGRRFSAIYDYEDIQSELASDGDEDPLLVVASKDDCVASWTPHLAKEENGVWIPYHIFPTPFFRFDFDVIRNLMRDPDVSMATKLGRGATRGLHISGFGEKSGEYMVLYRNQCIRVRGSGLVRERRETVTSTDAGNGGMWTETTLMENDEEALAMVAKEFPLLTDYCRDALQIFDELDGVE